MVNERQTDTCADVMYRRERQRGCGEAGLDFAPFIPSQDEVDQQMRITPEILRKLVEGLR